MSKEKDAGAVAITMKNRASENSAQISPLEEEVLTIVNGYVETYGFQILRTYEEASNGTRKLSIGTLYPLLARLERKNMVKSRMANKTDESGGARRKYYSITDKGKRALSDVEQFRQRLYRCALAGS